MIKTSFLVGHSCRLIKSYRKKKRTKTFNKYQKFYFLTFEFNDLRRKRKVSKNVLQPNFKSV